MWATGWAAAAAHRKIARFSFAGLFLGVVGCGASSNGENSTNTTGVMTTAAAPTSGTVGSGQTSGSEASSAASSQHVSSVGGNDTTSGGGAPPANAGGAPSSMAAATTAGGGADAPSSGAAATTAGGGGGTGGIVLTDCPEEEPELGVPCDTEQFGLCIYEWFRGDCTMPCAIYIRCNAEGETFQFEYNDGCSQCCLECGLSATTGG